MIAKAEKVEGGSKVLSRASWLAAAFSTNHLSDDALDLDLDLDLDLFSTCYLVVWSSCHGDV